MNFYTVDNVNNEIQILDGFSVEIMNALFKTIDEMPIAEDEKHKKIQDRAVILVKSPENLSVFGIRIEKTNTNKGDFYFIDKNESIGLATKDDAVYIGLNSKDEIVIKAEEITLLELTSGSRTTPKIK